ncbi:unnamed protein product [Protopolystoma xenopodis]|uniref:Uncharacterized protein n=1 Tax=Protopolystoma xenopodis TaxID=117903 RepID=A0A3S5AQF7_9PLAT|nr:unnamed protein product [Protopolystoma xenopodis]
MTFLSPPCTEVAQLCRFRLLREHEQDNFRLEWANCIDRPVAWTRATEATRSRERGRSDCLCSGPYRPHWPGPQRPNVPVCFCQSPSEADTSEPRSVITCCLLPSSLRSRRSSHRHLPTVPPPSCRPPTTKPHSGYHFDRTTL